MVSGQEFPGEKDAGVNLVILRVILRKDGPDPRIQSSHLNNELELTALVEHVIKTWTGAYRTQP